MDPRENRQLQEIEGYSEGIRYSLRDYAMIRTQERDGQIYQMVEAFPPRVRPIFLVANLICYVVRILVMIFLKLDSIEGHLIEQTLRERKKEAR